MTSTKFNGAPTNYDGAGQEGPGEQLDVSRGFVPVLIPSWALIVGGGASQPIAAVSIRNFGKVVSGLSKYVR